ncbi:MAG: ABC transporter substrate-binding protein [Candidatus Hadarchaeota archaeon]
MKTIGQIKKPVYLAIIVIVIVAVAGAGAYFYLSDSGSQSQEDEPIKFGSETFFSGEYAPLGPPTRAITDLIVEEVNQDPPLGREIERLWIRTESTKEGTIEAAKKRIEVDGIEIYNGVAQTAYDAQRDYLMEKNVFLPTPYGGGIDQEWGGTPEEPVFSSQPPDQFIGLAIVSAMKEALSEEVESISIVTDKAKAHIYSVEMIEDAAEEANLEIVEKEEVDEETSNFSSTIDRVMEEDPDAVALVLGSKPGGLYLKQAWEKGYKDIPYVGDTELGMQKVLELAGDGASNLYVPEMKAEGPGFDAYNEAWEESDLTDDDDVNQNLYTALHWDILIPTFLAVEEAGTTDKEDMAEAIREVTSPPGETVYTYSEGIEELKNGNDINFDGATGPVEFDEYGNCTGSWALSGVEDGEFTDVTMISAEDLNKYNPT